MSVNVIPSNFSTEWQNTWNPPPKKKRVGHVCQTTNSGATPWTMDFPPKDLNEPFGQPPRDDQQQ